MKVKAKISDQLISPENIAILFNLQIQTVVDAFVSGELKCYCGSDDKAVYAAYSEVLVWLKETTGGVYGNGSKANQPVTGCST